MPLTENNKEKICLKKKVLVRDLQSLSSKLFLASDSSNCSLSCYRPLHDSLVHSALHIHPSPSPGIFLANIGSATLITMFPLWPLSRELNIPTRCSKFSHGPPPTSSTAFDAFNVALLHQRDQMWLRDCFVLLLCSAPNGHIELQVAYYFNCPSHSHTEHSLLGLLHCSGCQTQIKSSTLYVLLG